MNVAIVTSVSEKIAELATLTVANKLEYALRHGYSLVVANRQYEEANAGMVSICDYLDQFDLVWTLDADAVITNMTQPVHELACLGPHVTVCEEGIVPWNRLNCGSVIWRNTPEARHVLTAITIDEPVWRPMPCGWQTWLAHIAENRPEFVTVAPVGAFNSCAWTHPANGPEYAPGTHWRPGHLVWHPCGVYPMPARVEAVRQMLATGVCR